ncbi:hypothetical protein AYJ54_19435 [Bradyrhizobium centrolobii]|uniref:IclR family transcriptional regulator n=1 Tax=Bradyrhizobium centrolobii TaxID=1505087 RepID=A0A176YK38_9BRAD|nr:IclR family transcriptional regulator C-terminal domain-containing protein [Bradyrhizobium centrolobii]OAF06693.1 hypothetical protein AYJ54_19435 [Bradyrhizobium centrolobii]
MKRGRTKRQANPKPSLTKVELGAGSFNRAVLILRSLAQDAHRGTSIRDIVIRTGLPRPTVHRVLNQLMDANWIEEGDGAQIYLGKDLACLGLAAIVRHPLQRIADQALERLAREMEQTVYLTLRVGYEAVCLARYEPENPIQTLVLQVGTREALGIGAGGMAILASLHESEARQIIEKNMQRYRQRSNFDEAAFQRAHDVARSRGHAAHDGLFRKGLSGIGVAVKDAAKNPLAAISTAFVSDWLDQSQRDHCAKLLQKAAADLSDELSLSRG